MMEDLMARVARRFSWVEAQRRFRSLLEGLLAGLPCKLLSVAGRSGRRSDAGYR